MKIHIHRNGQVYGPYSESSVRSFLVECTLSPTDLAWTSGRTEWTKLESLLGETGAKSSNPDLSSEDKENLDKIRDLVEKGEAEFALDLVRGLDSEEVVYALLEDWRIDEEDGSPIAPDWGNWADGFFLDLLNELPSERAEKLDSSIVPHKVRKLSLRGIDGMKNLDRVKVFPNMESLKLDCLNDLCDLEALAEFSKLTSLEIEDCSGLSSLESLSPVFGCHSLTKLKIAGIPFDNSVDCLGELTKLTELSLERCSTLENLNGLETMTNLRRLGLQGCSSVVSIDALEKVSELTHLDLSDCSAVENFGALSKLGKSIDLRLSGCGEFDSLNGIDDFPDLRHLDLKQTEVPIDQCRKLQESESFDYLCLPNGSTIENIVETEDPGGVLPRFEIVIDRGYGLEAHEGNLTQAQFDYWEDEEESNEFLDEVYQGCENDEIPEEARLGYWHDFDDISVACGCTSGTLEITEYRELKGSWVKKIRKYEIEDGCCESDEVEVEWKKDDRSPPEGPYFRGVVWEKASYCYHQVEGQTFDPSKLKLYSHSIFGGDYGEVIHSMDYDGEEVDFCGEGIPKNEEFKIFPAPEKEEEDSSDKDETTEEDSSDEEQDMDEIIAELDGEAENDQEDEEDFMDEMDEKPEDLPSGFVYLWSKAKTFLKVGPEAYRKRDAFGHPEKEWDEAIIRKGMEQVAEFRGYSADKPFEDLGISGFRMLLQTLHFELEEQSAQETEEDVFLDEMRMKHVVDNGRTITLYNKVSYEEDSDPAEE
jgi:hypothetical protein